MSFERRLLVIICFIVLVFVASWHKFNIDKKIKTFDEGNVLVCYGSLIVTNSNWSLSGNHLINKNSAGYINIGACE